MFVNPEFRFELPSFEKPLSGTGPWAAFQPASFHPPQTSVPRSAICHHYPACLHQWGGHSWIEVVHVVNQTLSGGVGLNLPNTSDNLWKAPCQADFDCTLAVQPSRFRKYPRQMALLPRHALLTDLRNRHKDMQLYSRMFHYSMFKTKIPPPPPIIKQTDFEKKEGNVRRKKQLKTFKKSLVISSILQL